MYLVYTTYKIAPFALVTFIKAIDWWYSLNNPAFMKACCIHIKDCFENKSNLFFRTSLYDWKALVPPVGIKPNASCILGECPNH